MRASSVLVSTLLLTVIVLVATLNSVESAPLSCAWSWESFDSDSGLWSRVGGGGSYTIVDGTFQTVNDVSVLHASTWSECLFTFRVSMTGTPEAFGLATASFSDYLVFINRASGLTTETSKAGVLETKPVGASPVGYHTFSIKWNPTYTNFYVDDVLVSVHTQVSESAANGGLRFYLGSDVGGEVPNSPQLTVDFLAVGGITVTSTTSTSVSTSTTTTGTTTTSTSTSTDMTTVTSPTTDYSVVTTIYVPTHTTGTTTTTTSTILIPSSVTWAGTVTSTSTVISTKIVPATVTSTVATVPGTSTVYTATTTGGYYTSYLYTWTYPGYTTVTIPTATVTVYGVSVQTIYTGVMTETQQYTVTVSQQNVATVGGGTTTLWSTQTLPTTAMLTVINGTTSVFVTESNYVEPSITVQTVTQTVNPPTTQQSTPEIPLWLIIAIILTAVGGGAVGLFFVLRRGGVLSRLRPKREEEEPEPAPKPKLDTDMKPPEGETETVAQPAPTQVSPSGKVMCGGCGAENIGLATTCELCGLPLVPRTTAESEDAMGKVGTGEGGAWHT